MKENKSHILKFNEREQLNILNKDAQYIDNISYFKNIFKRQFIDSMQSMISNFNDFEDYKKILKASMNPIRSIIL